MAAELFEMRLPPTRPGDRIEIALSYRDEAADGGVVVFSPHPLLGGDLDNNVVRALARDLAAAGRPALRFNYRSVGESAAVEPDEPRFEYWTRLERAGDHRAVLDDAGEAWRRARTLFEPRALVGYSYGGWVALQHAAAHAPDAPLVLVSPPVVRLDFAAIAEREAPTLLVFAAEDGFDPTPAEAELHERFPQAEIRVLPDVDHFFIDEEERLTAIVLEFLERVQPCAVA